MVTTRRFKLSVVKHHFGYMEFSVCFFHGPDCWNATGMSWLTANTPSYYLSEIYFNGVAATSYIVNAAGIFQAHQSIKFKCQKLVKWTTSSLGQYWQEYLGIGKGENRFIHSVKIKGDEKTPISTML